MNTIRIDLYADIACHWSYIGEARLRDALAQRPEVQVTWHWHPFQIQPDLPERGAPWNDVSRAKFGSIERAQTIFTHVAKLGEEMGIPFAFDRQTVAPNSLNAHRVILMTDPEKRRELVHRLFHAHFTEGANMSDIDTLVRIATEIGLEEGEVREYLASEKGRNEVRESQEEAERMGVTGIPFYIFNGRYAFSGAQSLEAFLRAVDAALVTTEETAHS